MLRGFFEWFNPKNVMDTPEEWHAWVIGFSEGLCPWRPNILPTELGYLQPEWHYYSFGRAMGFLGLVAFIVGMIKVILWN